ncbi:hypothetical protein BDV12DRAFT_173440 [Aspergillus spectabilis]
MSYLCSGGAQGADLSKCITELSSLLDQSLSESTAIEKPLAPPHYFCLRSNPPLYALSDPLLKALIAEASCVPASSEPLLSFINQHRDEIARGLETVSLQSLSTYLLKATTDDGLETALYLLLDEAEPALNSGSRPAPSNDPKSGKILPLVQSSLLQRTCTIFTDRTRHARARRMAGKVLAEMVYNSEELCRLLWQLKGEDHFRLIIDSLTDTDIVLSFFASTVSRALCLSGNKDAVDLGLNESQMKILHYIDPHEDSIQQFYFYVRAERQHLSSILGKTRLDGTHGALPTCFIVDSDGSPAGGSSQGPFLLILSADRLDLISCSSNTSSRKFDYIGVWLAKCTRTQCSFSGPCGRQKSSLSLYIHADDMVTKNEQRQDLQVVHLRITTRNDLTNLRRGLEAIGIPCRTQRSRSSQISRRSSSFVIALDAADEIDSSRYSEEPSRAVMVPTLHKVRWRNESKNSIKQLDYMSETGTDPASQSSLTVLSRTPTLLGTSSPNCRDGSHPSSPNQPKKDQQGETKREGVQELSVGAPRNECATDSNFNKDTQSKEETTHQDEGDTSQSGPAKNTRSKSSQIEKTVPTNTVLRPIPPNTQESLIFPRQRSRVKHYTTSNKTMVDWEEDLRTSDASAELTSISSPLPNGTSYAFNQNSRLRRKDPIKTKRATKKPAAKAKKRPRNAKKTKGKTAMAGQVKPISPPLECAGNGVSQNSSGSDVSRKREEPNAEASKQENCIESIEKPDILNDFAHSPKRADNSSHQAAKSSSPPRHSGQLAMISGSEDDRNLAEGRQGRGQSVAQKLIAALRGSITPKHHLDGTMGKQSGEAGYGAATIDENTEPQIDLFEDAFHGDYEAVQDDVQDIPKPWGQDLNQNVITVDETYSAKSLDGSQGGQLQNNEPSQNWILDGREVAFSHEGKGESKPAQETSSPVRLISSSVESPSTESIFEYFRTCSLTQPKENSPAFCDLSENGASSKGVHQKHGLPKTPIKDITIKYDNEAALLSTNRSVEDHNEDTDRAIKYLDSGSKIIMDKNGSPRLMQLASQEQVTLKRRAMSPILGQGLRGKQRKASHRADDWQDTLHPIECVQKQDDDSEPLNAATIEKRVVIEPYEDWLKRTHPGLFEKTSQESSNNHGTSTTAATGRERQLSFLDRLRENGTGRRSCGCLNSGSPELSATGQEQELPVVENKEAGLKFQGPSAGNLPVEDADSGRKVALELSKCAAGQLDWQTSLQELQTALLNNSKHISHQIESERTTAKKVLDGYRVQCHNVLDQLYEAQLQRIRLCKQQMNSIKHQYADVCQELINRLEEDERSLEAAYGSQ